MLRRQAYQSVVLCCLFASGAVASKRADGQRLSLIAQEGQSKQQSGFQAAVAAYNAGAFPQAASALEGLVQQNPKNFDMQELLGEAYASMSEDAKAVDHLEAAVKLRPNSGAARTNLAASLSRLGRSASAGEQFRRALALEPNNYSANHNLGEFYIQQGKIAQGRPLLERAQQINPAAYDNGYDLAMADLLQGQLAAARETVQRLLVRKNTGELHNLLGQIDEKDGKYVTAADEFETAAHMDPSEDNLFDWGGELLLHRTYEPAVDVFRAASVRYPNSPRIFIGLGMALYARGLYEDAVTALLKAADLAPSEQRCYLFLSRAYQSSPAQADAVIQRFERYASLEPENALAQYYYAMSLWKGKETDGAGLDQQKVESLLKRSIELNGSLAEVHLQLGNLYASQHQYDRSVPEYERALQLDANLPDAHYRLGTDYVHLGQKEKAQAEFAIYQKLRQRHMADEDRERAEVQQFVYSSTNPAPANP